MPWYIQNITPHDSFPCPFSCTIVNKYRTTDFGSRGDGYCPDYQPLKLPLPILPIRFGMNEVM